MTERAQDPTFSRRIDRYTHIPSTTIRQLIADGDFERFEIDQLIHIYDHLHFGYVDRQSEYVLHYWRNYHPHIFLSLLEEHPKTFRSAIREHKQMYCQVHPGRASMLERLHAERVIMRAERTNFIKAQKLFRYRRTRLQGVQKK